MMFTIETKEPIVVGETYIARDGAEIYISRVRDYNGQEYDYALDYIRTNRGQISDGNTAYWCKTGHMERDARQHEFDLMRKKKVGFEQVEDISSMFSFLKYRERELTA